MVFGTSQGWLHRTAGGTFVDFEGAHDAVNQYDAPAKINVTFLNRKGAAVTTFVSPPVAGAPTSGALAAPSTGDGGLAGAEGNPALPAALVALTAVFTVLVLRRALRNV
jgi:hypothetical protein